MEPKNSRIGIVFNGSPLFTGDAGSGESEIRKWIIENDLLETILMLPDKIFFNTGITTYFWILDNNKEKKKKRENTIIRRFIILYIIKNEFRRKKQRSKRRSVKRDI